MIQESGADTSSQILDISGDPSSTEHRKALFAQLSCQETSILCGVFHLTSDAVASVIPPETHYPLIGPNLRISHCPPPRTLRLLRRGARREEVDVRIHPLHSFARGPLVICDLLTETARHCYVDNARSSSVNFAMISLSKTIACAVLLAHYASAAPAVSYSAATSSASVASSTSISVSTSSSIASVSSVTSSIASASTAASAPAASPTVPYASDDPNGILWGLNTDPDPQAIRGSLGATIMGPQNIAIDQQNPDLLAPPSTDAGSIQNAKWPFGLSHNRLQTGGWARQENIDVMPIAQSMAGVNMRLEAGAIRELHWHKTAEWAYVLNGSVQVSAVNADGQNFLATVSAGDLWYFPPGIPHSLQATADNPNGAEFLLASTMARLARIRRFC
ncbi:Oxalate decarboxylase OxdC [Grifola frondosa]|uniref:Oxalate decarboxylase OxdC n=1 Tax=Grifola frondosa TaxID=5627 RepID=A0A1C7M625_GRIFR|nr:Oxalate decarboxylase OxdC [Grifola frondosa]